MIDDQFGAARGFVNGIAIAIILWALVIGVCARFL